MISATLTVWPKIKYSYCAFHLVQACVRNLKSCYGVSRPKSSTLTKEVHRVTGAIPYVPWNPILVRVFVGYLRKNCLDYYQKKLSIYEKVTNEKLKLKAKKELERAGRLCVGNEKYISYLERQFLSESNSFGYSQWGYSQEDRDRTNNKCEAANSALKAQISQNPKNYIKGVAILYEFLGEFISTSFEEVRCFQPLIYPNIF